MMDVDLGLAGPRATTRVVVAMSGGVDSSVVAALVKQAGYDVVGVTLQLYDHGAATHRAGACCAGQDIHDARDVAARLGIPALRARLRGALPRGGDRAFRRELCAGRDADPLRLLQPDGQVRRPAGDGARARRRRAWRPAITCARALVDGRRALFRPVDLDRDQSYFLFATTQEQLDFLRFPLGDLTKDETRAIARELGLKVADKHDSQDICFVPQGRYSDIVEKLKPEAVRPGEIVHVDGRVLGRHDGVIRYTVGQRRGLGIAAGEPLFVVRLDADERARRRRPARGARHALDRAPRLQLARRGRSAAAAGGGAAGLRARALDASAGGGDARASRTARPVVDLAADEMGVAPGQACVLYDGDGPDARVLGGGTIDARVGARSGQKPPRLSLLRPSFARARFDPAQRFAGGTPLSCRSLSGKSLNSRSRVWRTSRRLAQAGKAIARRAEDIEALQAQVETLKGDLASDQRDACRIW